MKVPPIKVGEPLTPAQLRAMSIPGMPERGVIVVLMSALMLAEWLEGANQPADERVITLEAVLPVGPVMVDAVTMLGVDLVFKETFVFEQEIEGMAVEGAD